MLMKGDRKFNEPGECRPSWRVCSFKEKQPDKGRGGYDPGEPPWAGWPQADLKLPMCSRGREFNWGETNMQSQDLELGVVRAGVRQRERWRLVPGFGA